MSKAALVLDEMPGVCADCPFDNDGKCYITGEDLYWNDGDNDDNSNIGNDCPLRQLPEWKATNTSTYKDWYYCGWNACLKEIEYLSSRAEDEGDQEAPPPDDGFVPVDDEELPF